MQNQRALAAACTAVAALGLAAPVAVADGMGNGGGSNDNTVITIPGTGNVGNGIGNGIGNGNGLGNGFGNGNGLGNGNGNLGRGDNGRGDNFGRGDNGRGDIFGDRGDGNPRNIIATPGVIAAGGRLTVTVDGCHGGTASSRAFRTIWLVPIRDDISRGEAMIDRDARPGHYDITVNCNGRTLTRPAAFTVLGGVQGGVGGSRTSGATSTDMAIGGGLVAAAVIGGGAFWLRRRHEKRI
ncbi:hypothetical protein AQI88_00775 [Streptomyces cellostaticus]|uniref:Gram-positive cocci surface proteins LPxTG domain-containing protein n=1 Tax=Streptomyces cellostaticus TaxID=67285 RepID=A0A101NT57_9ACTN|nr:hypothetical protein AQI88_00775 [Streptomyces cellostaticus]GHI03381.1 hypothetical protein Scel_17020 [Streptomyces cellostaticus]